MTDRLVFGQDVVCQKCHGKGTFSLRGAQLPCGICGGSGTLSSAYTRSDRAVARRTDPETSHEAAQSISSERIRESQQIVLAALRNGGPTTDAQLYEASASVRLHCSPSGARTRRAELVDLGKIRDTGERRTLEGGRRHIVWAAVE